MKTGNMRLIYLFITLLTAFVVCEGFLAYIVKYPKFKVGSEEYLLDKDLGPYSKLKTYPAHYMLLGKEDKTCVIKKNNFGLPGTDIIHDGNTKKIFILGNSFIEANQYEGDYIATSIMQNTLRKSGFNVSIYNLGSSGHDPYILWYRAKFFEKLYKPDLVVLVFESYSRLGLYFNRWKFPLAFELSDDFGERVNHDRLKEAIDNVKGNSRLFTLLLCLRNTIVSDDAGSDSDKHQNKYSDKVIYNMLVDCLAHFSRDYNDKFMFLSIMSDNPYESELNDFCAENSITYAHKPSITRQTNLINGNGHLNKRGNYELGKLLTNYVSDKIDE